MQISEGEVFLQIEGDSRQLFDYRLVAEVALESESIIGGDACWGGGASLWVSSLSEKPSVRRVASVRVLAI